MRSDKTKLISGMSTRQKATVGVFVLVVLFLIWQVWGLIRGGSAPAHTTVGATATPASTTPGLTPVGPNVPPPPQPAQIKQPQPMTQREIELTQLQQQTEQKYLAALNDLQMLKLSQQMAEANQAIAAARLATVKAEKTIVDLLKPPPITPATYSQGLINPMHVTAPTPAPVTVTVTTPETAYSVISVTELQNRWSAVIGFSGNLFHVSVGDILPPDQSKVVSIDRSGVILEKNGLKRKVSMVSII